jgi:HD superfamily phosphohydrolase YqeK
MAAGFFTAPASTKYHGNYEGGLFDHSFAVTTSLLSLTKRMGLNWKRKASPYIVGMLHDLCKCDSYIHNPDCTYSYNPNILLPGHGDKSVILAQKIVDLTDEEMACIRWHMGAFDDKENWDKYGKSIEKYPNVLWTHTADMMAARIFKI